MLGSDLSAVLRDRGDDVTAASRGALDVTDAAAVSRSVSGHDIVVNCAAGPGGGGGGAEDAAAYALTAEAPRLLAGACGKRGALRVHISPDSVFDGTASEPYPEDHPLAPLNAY